MKLPNIERHSFIDAIDSDISKKRLEEIKRVNLIKSQFSLNDMPILCTPDLLEENIEKIKIWFQDGGRIKQYSKITPFKSGLSVVTLKDLNVNKFFCDVVDKIGVINEEGTEIIPCSTQFKDIVVLNENLIRVQNHDDSYSLFSLLTGKEIEPKKLYYLDTDFHDGLLVGLVNSPKINTDYESSQSNLYFYFDEYGNIALSSNNYALMGQFKDDLALASSEKCISPCPYISQEHIFIKRADNSYYRIPEFAPYEYMYEYHKYLINKKGEKVKDLGTEIVGAENNLSARRDSSSLIKDIIFTSDFPKEFNKNIMGDLKFSLVKKKESLPKGRTEDLRTYILNNGYNPEKEIEKTIEKVIYLTNNWEEIIEYIDYNDDVTIKEIHSQKVPYIYYLNRDSYKLDRGYVYTSDKGLLK